MHFFKRTLPPVAAPIMLGDLVRSLGGLFFKESYLESLKLGIRDHFGVRHVFLASSGKAALTIILEALKSISPRREVVIPAYTCFSVPASILKAGLIPTLCDIDSGTLDFDFGAIEKVINNQTLCILPTHLFGIPSGLDLLMPLAKRKGAYVVEDAAQSMGGTIQGNWLGTVGDVGFFSLGRGKNITCGSGGIIVTHSDAMADAIGKVFSRLENEPTRTQIYNWVQLLFMKLFIKPTFYWIPAGIPWLGLGETKFEREFSVKRMGGMKGAFLASWKGRLKESNVARQNATAEMIQRCSSLYRAIPSGAWEGPLVYLRLPLMMESKALKDEVCSLSFEKGLGISPMYPRPIHQIDEIKSFYGGLQFPNATAVAERLITIPVHPLTSTADRDSISQLVSAYTRERDEGGETVRNKAGRDS